jgi:nitrite reductase/ring-hydroxylating ferredoxin subunit
LTASESGGVTERAVVLPSEGLPQGARVVVEAFGTQIAVFNVFGKLYAVNNSCPHHGGPLCHGIIDGAPVPSDPHQYEWGLQDRVLVCPWHGWEFDLATGQTLFDDTVAVAGYDIRVEDGQIVLYTR